MIELLERLAQDAEERGELREAIELTRRQVERDRFDEEAHRRLIERFERAGDRAGAMRIYRGLAERLRRELGVAPSRQTRELVERVRAATPAPPIAGVAPMMPGLLALVGRDTEVAELERTWAAVCSGSGAVAVVRGEAGIGKTRLTSELRSRARASGGLTATGAALDLGGSAPLSLWAELIRELLPALDAPPPEAAWPDDLAVLTSELPAHFEHSGAPSSTVAPDLQRTRLFEAVVALLGWAARQAPVLLVLEDVHTADGPSLELAGYAARRAAGLRVMIVMSRRELPRSADADRLEQALRARGLLACELELGPLGSESVAALARQAARLSEADVTRVLERAEGNALLAVETARALGRGRDDVAPSLLGSVRATLAPLSEDARDLVELAAVAARPLDAVELGRLPLVDPEEAASAALESGLLLAAGDGIAFRHALLSDAVYEEIAGPRRRGLHQRWAHALLACEQAGAIRRPAEVARHLRLAGADAEAVPQLARAAADARRVAALAEAVAYLEEALAIAPARAELWLEPAELEAWQGRREESEAAFGRALALLEGAEPLELARAWLRRARAYHGPICFPRVVLESARTALELLVARGCPSRRSARSAARRSPRGPGPRRSRAASTRRSGCWRSSARGRDAGGELHTYDVGHARALALMRRGRFVESYGPSIAAGEAIERAGRPDLAYGCWANVASAAGAAGEQRASAGVPRSRHRRDRRPRTPGPRGPRAGGKIVRAAQDEAARGCPRRVRGRAGAGRSARPAASWWRWPATTVGWSHSRRASTSSPPTLLAQSLVDGAPISRPLTRLALAEALARGGHPDEAAEQIRATVLEPVRPSDFPAALVPRLARVQGLDRACARATATTPSGDSRSRSAAGSALLGAGPRREHHDRARRPRAPARRPGRTRARARAGPCGTRKRSSHDKEQPMPSFHDTATSSAPPEEVWKLLYDPSRFPDWWAGNRHRRGQDDGQYTMYPDGYPDFPMAQLLDTPRTSSA